MPQVGYPKVCVLNLNSILFAFPYFQRYQYGYPPMGMGYGGGMGMNMGMGYGGGMGMGMNSGFPPVSFAKTKLCLFYEKGECSKGDHCTFAHGEAELRPCIILF